MFLEVCVDTVQGLQAATKGGADRVELCSALDVGGLTPSFGLMQIAGAERVPVFAMIRPRGGDFTVDIQDIGVMITDIDAAREAGLAGVVFGASLADGRLDRATLSQLLGAAEDMQTTLHRGFDLTPDPFAALETAIDLGFTRILTSGGAKNAPSGAAVLAQLQAQAQGRIGILPGGGITPKTLKKLTEVAPFNEVHASCSRVIQEASHIAQAGFGAATKRVCDPDIVRLLRSAITALNQ